jgi:carbon starvation protein CstA
MIDWNPPGAPPIIPILFITVACGACSGFHCLVGSGTTSKQLARERDAKAVGYGSMLTEGFLAVIVIAACAGGIGLGVTGSLAPATRAAQYAAGLYDAGQLVIQRDDNEVLRVDVLDSVCRGIDMPGSRHYEHDPETRRQRKSQEINDSAFVYGWEGVGDDAVHISAEVSHDLSEWIPLQEGSLRIDVENRKFELHGPLVFARTYSSWQSAGGLASTVGAFVEGGANFLTALAIPRHIAIALMAVMVASFAATTMDTSCRLQRYVVQELGRVMVVGRRSKHRHGSCPSCGYDLTGIDPERAVAHDGAEAHTRCPECSALSTEDQRRSEGVVAAALARASWWNPFKWLTTAHGATIFAVVTALALAFIPPAGQAWSLSNAGMGAMTLWPLFGAVNQLLAGFAFIVIIAWLRLTGRPWWFAVVPALLMLVMPAWALVWQMAVGNADNPSWIAGSKWPLAAAGAIALALEAWLVTEAVVRWSSSSRGDESR